MPAADSSVSNDGRGLKRQQPVVPLVLAHDSSVSNDGRGLKLADALGPVIVGLIRPSAMTDVD